MRKKCWRLGRKVQFLCLLLCSAFPAHAAVFYPETYTLANGMRVVIVPHHLSDAVAHMVWYKAGAVDDPIKKSGIAHYLEHMMFKGSQKLAAGAYSTQIARLGGTDNAFTSHDVTAFHVKISKDHLPLVMQMEAERMRSLLVNSTEAQTERDVVLRERSQRTDNKPMGLFYEKLNHLFWGSHAYGRPVIGWRDEITKLSTKDIKDFYQCYYAPNNAILVVSGNVKTKAVLGLAAATFGRLNATADNPRQFILVAPNILPSQKQFVMKDARVKQPFWIKKILAPSYHQSVKQAVALEVLIEILSGGEVGLLYRYFVVDKKSAAFVGSSYDPVGRGPSTFSFMVTPSSGIEIYDLEKRIEKYLKRLAEKGISPKGVKAAQQRMLDEAIFARDGLMGPAQILGGMLAAGLSVGDVEDWPSRVMAVTVAQVNQALRALLKEPHYMTGMLLPADKEVVK